MSAIAATKDAVVHEDERGLWGRARGTSVEAAAARLQVGALAQAADRRAHLRGLRSVHRVRAAREHLFARLALPDPHRRPLHGVLPAEEAREARVLGDLDLLHLLAERRAVPDTVLAGDPNLLCPLLRLRGEGAGGSAGRGEGAGGSGGANSEVARAARAGRKSPVFAQRHAAWVSRADGDEKGFEGRPGVDISRRDAPSLLPRGEDSGHAMLKDLQNHFLVFRAIFGAT